MLSDREVLLQSHQQRTFRLWYIWDQLYYESPSNHYSHHDHLALSWNWTLCPGWRKVCIDFPSSSKEDSAEENQMQRSKPTRNSCRRLWSSWVHQRCSTSGHLNVTAISLSMVSSPLEYPLHLFSSSLIRTIYCCVVYVLFAPSQRALFSYQSFRKPIHFYVILLFL